MAQEREESQGFFEMLWDCEFCDTKGLLAKSQRYCANCGAPQNPDKRYFPKEGEQVRVDGHQFEGADRTCPACSSPMSALAKNCTHCGSVLDGAAEVRGVLDAPLPAAAQARPAPRRRRRIWPFVLGALVIAGFGIWLRCIRTQEAQVVVAGHSWQRVIAIEEFNERQEEAWRNEIPVDASFPICHDKERSSRQVADGEDCHNERHDKKDGTFEQVKKCKPKTRSEPVMDSWCRFTARRWRPVTELKASGTGLTPAWPTGAPPATVPASQLVLGARRGGKQTETLTLEFKDHGTCDVSDALWHKYTDGQKLKLEVHASGDVACGAL
ncbi:MAG TPA: zinc ribbon domain-containing protein [Kofleriaceae bacterium]|jgi:hypothetical protein|nr:zinc ribbon domain-containing protein [Kofleriaceae bacterium]